MVIIINSQFRLTFSVSATIVGNIAMTCDCVCVSALSLVCCFIINIIKVSCL